eukprot:TRINITY_DN7396_c0_g1_i1.p1 TRINITY_DN7396_c0_g1~~TRINITY_DN7396_c0_g1_i1.p1  ORF type:complete len:129 (-),score=3.96 TRINITY_DN7396_c0_g1_i1:198-584(-)
MMFNTGYLQEQAALDGLLFFLFGFLFVCFLTYFCDKLRSCCCPRSRNRNQNDIDNEDVNSRRSNIRIIAVPANINIAVDPLGQYLLANTVINSSPRLSMWSEGNYSSTPVLYQMDLCTDTESDAYSYV